MFLYTPIKTDMDYLIKEKDTISAKSNYFSQLQQKLHSNCSREAKIRIDYDYGDGYVFFTRDLEKLLQELNTNWLKKGLSAANIVTMVTVPCSVKMLDQVEIFLRNTWFQLFISHHIVFLIDCEVNMRVRSK